MTSAEQLYAHLDRRVSLNVSGVPNTPGLVHSYIAGAPGLSINRWTLPYAQPAANGTLILTNPSLGIVYTGTRPADNQWEVQLGDFNWSGQPVYLGVLYPWQYRLSTLFKRDENQEPDTRGRLKLGYMDVLFADTGSLTSSVTTEGRTVKTKAKTATLIEKGVLRVPIMSQNDKTVIELSDTSSGPVNLTGVDWEGFHHTRARRI